MQALMYVIVTCKYKKNPIKNSRENVMTPFSPIITLWELSVAMETRVLTWSAPKPNAAFESVDGRTDAGSSPIL